MIKFAMQTSAKTTQLKNVQYRDFNELSNALLAKHTITDSKDGKAILCASYKDTERNEDNIQSLQIIPIDVDNDIDNFGYIVTFDEVCEKLENEGLEFSAYTSFSNTERNPKFRVLIPISREVSVSEFKKTVHYIKEVIFNSADMFDQCMYKAAQPYFLPATNNIKDAKTLYNKNGRALDVDTLLLDYKEESTKFSSSATKTIDTTPGALINRQMHRRDRLLRIICACYFSDRSVEHTAERIADYDLRYHHEDNGIFNGPYFLDFNKHSKFAFSTTIENATKFVETEFYSLRNKETKQRKRSSEFQPIFNLIFQ